MTEQTYFTIGTVAMLTIWVYVSIPFLHLLLLQAKDLIQDVHTPTHKDNHPSNRIKNIYWLCGDDLIVHLMVCVFVSFLTVFAWPILIISLGLYGSLLFLRMVSRLKRHTQDKDAHK